MEMLYTYAVQQVAIRHMWLLTSESEDLDV